MIITTTNDIQGRTVSAYLGIVSGDAVMGTNIFRDIMASVRDIVGGRSGSYEKILGEAKVFALTDLQARAAELGADAVIGLNVIYEVVGGDKKTMLVVSAVGTAVKL